MGYYYIRVYDNYHYMDESEAYNVGNWRTYEEALKEAKKNVYKWLYDECQQDSTKDKLIASYCFYGEDPAILYESDEPSTAPSSNEMFSGRDYANQVVEEIIVKKKTLLNFEKN
jgi:hypothetical protein